MDRLRILQINKLYHPWIGGIETVIKEAAEFMNDRTDMTVLVCRDKGRGVTERVNGVKVVRAGSLGIKFSMPISLSFPFLVRKLSKNADVILLHDPFPLGDLAVLLSGFRGKVIVWWHSDIVKQKKLLQVISPMIHAVLRRADAVFVSSEGYIDGSAFMGQYRDKCRVVPYGIDTEKYLRAARSPVLQSRLYDKGNVRLLFVGRLVYYKGADVLLRAMRDITGGELFLVGSGADEESLKEYARENHLEKKVHFIPPLPDDELRAAFADCDIFVFPSVAKSEAFGIVQLEAMVYGKPVINTRLGTSAEHVSLDGITGITVEPGDSAALAEAMTRLIKDRELREELGKNAAGRVCEKFELKRNYENMFDQIRSVAKEK